MAKSHLRVVAPTEVNRTVRPKRQKNSQLRTREHFTPDEVEALIEVAGGNRCGHRDATMVLDRAWSASAAALSFVPCLRHVDDEIGDQRPQFYYRGNLHEQCNIALHLKVIDFESDAQE
jgi:hypothetical protein